MDAATRTVITTVLASVALCSAVSAQEFHGGDQNGPPRPPGPAFGITNVSDLNEAQAAAILAALVSICDTALFMEPPAGVTPAQMDQFNRLAKRMELVCLQSLGGGCNHAYCSGKFPGDFHMADIRDPNTAAGAVGDYVENGSHKFTADPGNQIYFDRDHMSLNGVFTPSAGIWPPGGPALSPGMSNMMLSLTVFHELVRCNQEFRPDLTREQNNIIVDFDVWYDNVILLQVFLEFKVPPNQLNAAEARTLKDNVLGRWVESESEAFKKGHNALLPQRPAPFNY